MKHPIISRNQRKRYAPERIGLVVRSEDQKTLLLPTADGWRLPMGIVSWWAGGLEGSLQQICADETGSKLAMPSLVHESEDYVIEAVTNPTQYNAQKTVWFSGYLATSCTVEGAEYFDFSKLPFSEMSAISLSGLIAITETDKRASITT
jgi:hypothetical protein